MCPIKLRTKPIFQIFFLYFENQQKLFRFRTYLWNDPRTSTEVYSNDGVTNYRSGSQWTTSDYIVPHRTASDHI